MDKLYIEELREDIKEIDNLISACICILGEDSTECGNFEIKNSLLARDILAKQISIKLEMIDVCLWKTLRNEENE